MLRCLLIVGVGGAMAACSSGDFDLAGAGSSHGKPIYFGTTAPNDAAVVALTMSGQGAFCTGTLITPTVVLTAAHCLDDIESSLSWVRVFFGSNANGSGTTRSVSRIQQHPSYGWSMDGDIGLVEMTSAAPSGTTPVPFLPASQGLTSSDVGGTVRFVGYGFTETGAYGTRRQVGGTIGRVCSSSSGCSYLGQGLVNHSFGYSQSEGGPCQGDSGGPAFITRGGSQYVAGVTSYGDADCAIVGVSTTVDDYESFITAFTGGTTTPPSDPVDPPATCTTASCTPGAPCASDAACGAGGFCIDTSDSADFVGGYCSAGCASHDQCAGDALCVDNGGQGICMDACTQAADCRSGYTCQDAGGASLCLPQLGGSGPSPIGDVCARSADCATNGAWCYSPVDGFPAGLCTIDCSTSSECPSGTHCSEGLCLESCTRSSDCRGGYTCWPETNNPALGACWVACTSAADCDGQACNAWGLCGTARPPDTTGGTPQTPGTQPTPGVGELPGSPRSSDYDNGMSGGCAAAAGQPLLAALWLLLRRRRR